MKSWTSTSSGSPCGCHSRPPLLEFPDDFLLFGVHRDHRLALFLKRRHGRVDMLELGVAVGVIAPFFRFAVALQTVPGRLQQSSHGARADGMSLSCQFVRQVALCSCTSNATATGDRHGSTGSTNRSNARTNSGSTSVDAFATSRPVFAVAVARDDFGIGFPQFRVPFALWQSCSATCPWPGLPPRRHPNHTTSLPLPPTDDASVRPSAKPKQHTEIQSLNGGCILHGRLIHKSQKI